MFNTWKIVLCLGEVIISSIFFLTNKRLLSQVNGWIYNKIYVTSKPDKIKCY